MRVLEWTFSEAASVESRRDLQKIVEQAASLDEIFDLWFLERGNRLGLSVAVEDDGKVSDEKIALFFDTGGGVEVGTAYLSRRDIMEMYPGVSSFDSFVKGWNKQSPRLALHEDAYASWIENLGFIDSYALMCRVGPREAAIPLMVSFALSKNGAVEAHHIDAKQLNDEDYKADLDEEGIDLRDYFNVYASYLENPASQGSMMTMFDPFYCHKRV